STARRSTSTGGDGITSAGASTRHLVGELDDGRAGAAPPAGDGLDALVEHLLVLDLQVTADRVVVEPARAAADRDVEARDVAARGAAITGGSHPVTVPTAHRRSGASRRTRVPRGA